MLEAAGVFDMLWLLGDKWRKRRRSGRAHADDRAAGACASPPRLALAPSRPRASHTHSCAHTQKYKYMCTQNRSHTNINPDMDTNSTSK